MAAAAVPLVLVDLAAVTKLATDVCVVTAGTVTLAANGYKLSGVAKGIIAAKSAEAAGVSAIASTAATTATTLSATASTATAATTATTTAATTTSTTAWLASLAMTPVGMVVIGGIAGCAAYYAYRKYKSWQAMKSKASETTSKVDELHDHDPHHESDSGSDTPSGPPPGLGKPVLIPKKELEKLLMIHGRKMYHKLKSVLKGDRSRQVWSNRNYRIDPGHTIRGHPNLRTWNLQVQSQAESAVARSLKQAYGTHKKLLWDVFNVERFPSYRAWVNRLMSLYN